MRVFDWHGNLPEPENFEDCKSETDRMQWLFNRLMAIEEIIYGKTLLQKLISGLLQRPKGWEPKEKGANK